MPNKTIYGEQRGASGDTEHNKFYEIEDNQEKSVVVFRWGSIAQYAGLKNSYVEGPRCTVISGAPEVRAAAFAKQFKAKFQRKANPYVQISVTNGSSVQKTEDRPDSVGRRWGVEIETHSNLSVQEIASKMQSRDLEVVVDTGRYFHSTGRQWDVKRDGSCGFEFASPILSGDAGIFDAKLAVEKIQEECPTAVNSNCGLHVTVDVSDFSDEQLKQLVVGYLKAQEHFYSECNNSRQNNQYCKRNPTSRIRDIIGMPSSNIKGIVDLAGGWRDHSNRYHGLNFTRTFTIRVVEFRMMESTISPRKVGAWIRRCVNFVEGIKAKGLTFYTTEPMPLTTSMP